MLVKKQFLFKKKFDCKILHKKLQKKKNGKTEN